MPSKASSGKNPFRPGNDPPTLRPAFPGLGLVPRGLDVLSDMRVGIKINLVLLGLGLLPPLAALLFLHQAGADHFQNVLALYIAAFLVVFYPLAKVLEELLVLRQIRRVNRFVEEVKSGRRTPYYELPDEQGDEHHVLRLEHNIFWMVHGLKTRESRLEDTLSKLDHARRRILESIEYASLIQRSFLPSPKDLRQALGDHFLLWLPRDGVGGDACWIKKTETHTLLSVFDCTGHGVPGAFLTLIVSSLFEQHCDQACCNDPGRLLSRMNRAIKEALPQHDRKHLSDDGLEGAVMLNHLHTFYQELRQGGVLFCFCGPTSQSVVEGIGQALRRKMELEKVGMTTIQRVFSIFVEQMQNIVNYSAEKTPSDSDDGAELKDGVVIVGRCHGKFYIICGNKARQDQGQKMFERIMSLQKMDKKAINDLYKRLRRHPPDHESLGAGLGFIEMFRRATEPLECHVVPLDRETVFFSIKAIG